MPEPQPLAYAPDAPVGHVEPAADRVASALALTTGFRKLVDNVDPPADASAWIEIGPAIDPWEGEAAAHLDDLAAIGTRAYIGQPEEDGEGLTVVPGSGIASCPYEVFGLRIILRKYLRNIDSDRKAAFRYVSDCMTAIGPQLGKGLQGVQDFLQIRQVLTPAYSSDKKAAGQGLFIESVYVVDLGDRGAQVQ